MPSGACIGLRNRSMTDAIDGALLSDKSVLRLAGSGAAHYLQGQFTQDVRRLKTEPVIYGCVLTPQGKTVADAWVVSEDDGSLLLVHEKGLSESLLPRLRMFTLGHDVRIEETLLKVVACWPKRANVLPAGRSFSIPLFPDTVFWCLVDEAALAAMSLRYTLEDWERQRILGGLPRLGCEWLPGEYPMNASLRERGGISFDKGCYVGQEISSRMHWRGGVRHALYCVGMQDGEGIACPAEVATTAVVGRLGSLVLDDDGNWRGIARLPAGSENGQGFTVDGRELIVLRPCGAASTGE